MIVTVLGGNSISTPSLIEALAGLDVASSLTVRLAGRDQTRLQAVSRACRMLAPYISIETFEAAEWASAVENAGIVLIQTRIGGQRGRESDETLAIRCGVPADEGLGAGGLSCAVRSWPRLRTILAMVRLRNPSALTVLLTSPAGLLIRLAGYEWPDWKIYAICELPHSTLLDVCTRVGCGSAEVDFAYTGVNHLGFLHSITAGGEDVVRKYANDNCAPLADVVRRWHAIPLKYLRLHFDREQVVEEQARQQPRGAVLGAMQGSMTYEFANGGVSEIASALLRRPAPWYRHAVAPLIAARVKAGSSHPFFLSSLEPDGTVRERRFSVSPTAIEAAVAKKVPCNVEALTAAFASYENVAARAIWKRDRNGLKSALQSHPWANPATTELCAAEIWSRSDAAYRDLEKGGTSCLN